MEGREGDCGLLMTEQILLPAVLILDTPSMSLLPSRRRMNSRKKVILALPSWIVSLETWNFTYCTCTCIYDMRRGFVTHMYKTPISISKLNCAGHVLTNDRPHRLHWEYGHITCHAHVHDKSKQGKYIHPEQLSLFFKEKTALGGIRTHDTPRSRRALYQLSYQGSSAG